MPKRKREDSSDRIERKIRKLEEKLQRRSCRKRRQRRHRSYTTESDSSSPSRDSRHSQMLEHQDENMDYGNRFGNDDSVSDNPPGMSGAEEPQIIRSVVTKVTENSPPVIASDGSAPPAPEPVTLDPPVSQTSPPETEELGFDREILDILGTDPTADKKYGKKIQQDLSVRLQHWTTVGLSKDLKRELKESYLTPENCHLIDPPELNAEIKAAISDIVAKRDKAIEGKQKQLTCAIACLGEAITHVLSLKEKDTTLLKLLMDSARLVCDCQHADTLTRRGFLLSSVKREMREQLHSTKVDKLLFGENLAETLKSAKAINKSGTDLKPSAPKPQIKKAAPTASTSSKNLNWKTQGQVRRLTGPPRMKEPAMTSTRGRPPASSRPSYQPHRSSHKRQ